jgi:hypothetical protein
MMTLIGLGVAVNILNSIAGDASHRSTLSMINTVQLLLLLPLIGKYLPIAVYDFIVSMSFSLFNFNFLKTDEIANSLTKNLDFEQQNVYLNDIGFESGSSIINAISLALAGILIPVIHTSFYLINWLYNKSKDPESLYFYNLFRKLYLMFMLDVYVGFIFEVFLFLLLMCLSSFNQYEIGEGTIREYISLGFSFLVAL